MQQMAGVVLIMGSGPAATEAAGFARSPFSAVVAINNAWRIRPDWSHLIFPEDFPPDRRPDRTGPDQVLVTARDFVPAQNALGGFVYAGGTMAFTAGYWVLHALRPAVMAFVGCDMVYPRTGPTHFYGTGTADPLRDDITLQNLEAKSARLQVMAARRGCHCVNLSRGESRLVFDRATVAALPGLAARPPRAPGPTQADRREAELGYVSASGRYWEEQDRFDAGELRRLDTLWLEAHAQQAHRAA